jgi:hypothetical protein
MEVWKYGSMEVLKHKLPTVNRQLSTPHELDRPPTINHQPSTVNRQPSTVNRQQKNPPGKTRGKVKQVAMVF